MYDMTFYLVNTQTPPQRLTDCIPQVSSVESLFTFPFVLYVASDSILKHCSDQSFLDRFIFVCTRL